MSRTLSREDLRIRAWRHVWIYGACIAGFLPFTPNLRNELSRFFSLEFLVNGSILLFFAVSVALVTVFRKKKYIRMLPYFLIWACVLLGLLMFIPIAVERTHIPEYGLLSILLFRAFRLSRYSLKNAYLLSLMWAIVAGTLDEFIQHLLPNRYFAWRDIALNIIGSVVGLLSYRFYEWVRKTIHSR